MKAVGRKYFCHCPPTPPTSISSHIIFLLRNQRDQQTLVSACEPNFDCRHLTRDPAKPANNGSRSQLFLCGKCFFSQSLSWSERMLPFFYIYCQCMTIAIISVKENALDTSFSDGGQHFRERAFRSQNI